MIEPARRAPGHRSVAVALGLVVAMAGCGGASSRVSGPSFLTTAPITAAPLITAPPTQPSPITTAAAPAEPVATTVPPVPGNASPVYGYTSPANLSAATAAATPLVYVPSTDTGVVTVIDPATYEIVGSFDTGKLAQHVVPSWDLATLYAAASGSNKLFPIDPATGQPGEPIPIAAPYNLYFSPDGTAAIVMSERRNRMDYYDVATWELLHSTPTGECKGVNHADWSTDLTWFLATCEFSGDILKVDSASGTIMSSFALPDGAMPQDLRLAPDGSKFYVADMATDGVWVLAGDGSGVVGRIDTGVGTHGIYPSRDAKLLYVTNRGRHEGDLARRSSEGDGSISLVDPSTDTVVGTWTIPGGGSPDMGGVSADGTTLWLSGRYDDEVYAIDTATGELKARIPVPGGPHGLCVFPQPGRFSLGHTGNMR